MSIQGLSLDATTPRDSNAFFSFIELCWGKATVAYKKPPQWKEEEGERLRGERDYRELEIIES